MDCAARSSAPTGPRRLDAERRVETKRRASRAAMNRYASGDNSAFPQVYRLLAPTLRRFLLRQTHNVDRASDLLQQTMLQLHRARGRFRRDADVAPWAIAIARRIFIDSIRARKREAARAGWPEDDRDEPTIDELLHAKRMARVVERELAKLPASQRDALRLTAKGENSLAEAAKLLGTTTNAMKVRRHRARLTLKAAIGEKFGPANR